MAEINEITIHQTLHGYKGGHKLLSSSVELSVTDKRTMLNLSDYSGSGVEKNFLNYVTGYPLPFSKFYVFAKTWYAEEMNRPGCVWTHSLLINFTDLLSIGDTKTLLELFKRPQESVEYQNYNQKLHINNLPVELENSKIFYKISCEIYENANKGIVILGDSSTQYETEILNIWNWQWPRMKRNFTFSTGSLSLRKFENQVFDLQILPFKREKALAFNENNQFKFIDLNINGCDNDWIEKYEKIDLRDFKNYMIKYGSDVIGNRENFPLLVKSYFYIQTHNTIELEWANNFFKYDFVDSKQGNVLKSYVIDQLINNSAESKFKVIQFILESKSFSNIDWNFEQMILSLWNINKINKKELIEIVYKLVLNRSESVQFILNHIDANIWIDSDLDVDDFTKLLSISPALEMNSSFWNCKDSIQEKWFSALKNRNDTTWENVVVSMLEVNSDKFCFEIHQNIGIEIITILINWISLSEKSLPYKWELLIIENQEFFFLSITQQSALTKSLLKTTLRILVPYDKIWKTISTEVIIKFLLQLNNINTEPESTGLHTFFLTACYRNNISNPELVNNIIFQNLYDRLKTGQVDSHSWEQFKWNLGRDVDEFTSKNRYFHGKNKIHDWDRCEFLVRSLLVSFLRWDWDPMNILIAVKDKNTFEKVVAFGTQIKEGKRFFENVFLNLRKIDSNSSFHKEVLRRHIN